MKDNQPPTKRWGRRVGWAIAIAVAMHVVAAILLFATPLRQMFSKPSAKEVANSSAAGESTQLNRGEQQEPVSPVDEPKPKEQPQSPAPLAGDVRDKISSAIRDAEDAQPEENLKQLSKLTQQLDNVGTKEGISEIAGKVSDWTGTQQRASQPNEQTTEDKPFDYDTAQLHEVKREKGKNGDWVYKSVLLDANGSTTETEMDATSGKTAYDTMQIVKSSPFADAVYRRIAMPMMDQIIETSKQAEKLQAEMERLEREAAAKETTSDPQKNGDVTENATDEGEK